jgi:CelD/BcsL family acetyltransferase involved in cellulose biosynthesis
MLGSGKTCSDNTGLYCLAGAENECAEAVATHLHRSDIEWDWIEWDGIQPDRSESQALIGAIENQLGIRFCTLDGPQCWTTSLEGGFEGFLGRCSKRAKRMLKAMKAEYLDSGRAALVHAQSTDQVATQLEQISFFHQARWKEKGIEGCFASGGFARFLQQASRRMHREGTWASAVLCLDGQMCAGMIGAVCEGVLSTYLVGVDPSYLNQRAGWMLNLALANHACEAGWKAIDFMRGDEEYKQRLGAVGTRQVCLTAAAPRPIPRLRQAAYNTGLRIKDWVRATRQRCRTSSKPVPNHTES